MRYDLIAPNAVIAALDGGEEFGFGRMIDSGAPLHEDAPEAPALVFLATENASGDEAGQEPAEPQGDANLPESGGVAENAGDAESLAGCVAGSQALDDESGESNLDEEMSSAAFEFSEESTLALSQAMGGPPQFAPQPPSASARYANIVGAAMNAVRQTMLTALGELDITIAHEAMGMPLESSGLAAQSALSEFSAQSEHPREWSAEEFASELRLRGFPSEIAGSHAQALNALMDEEAESPDDLSAAVEIKLDAKTSRMESASLYLTRPSAQKMAMADIRWVRKNGQTMPEARITVGYVH